MLQFCRNRLKIEQNCKTLFLMLVQILCYLLLVVINWALLLTNFKTRNAFFEGVFKLQIQETNDSASKA